MRAVVHQAALFQADRGRERRADGALGHERPGLLMHGVPTHHVADGELDAVSLAGRQHGPRLAQAAGHGLLAKDGARRIAGGGQNRLRSMPAGGRGNAEEVGALLVQHSLEVAVAAQGRKLALRTVKRRRIHVADSG